MSGPYGGTRSINMGKLVMISDHKDRLIPHKVSIVICLKCYNRWIATRPVGVTLNQLECDPCGPGFVIETGEHLE